MFRFSVIFTFTVVIALVHADVPFHFNAFTIPTNNTGSVYTILKDPLGNVVPTGGPNTSGGAAIYAGKKPNGANFFCVDLGAFGHQCTDETGSYNSVPTGNPAAPYVCGYNATNTFDHELAQMSRCTAMPQTISERGVPGLLSQVCYFCTYLDAGSVDAAPIASEFCVTDLVGNNLDNRLVLWRAEQVYRPRDANGACIGDVGMKALIQLHTPDLNRVPDQRVFWDRVQAALGPKAAACANPLPANVLFCYA